jgi:ABC-type sugar transport system permease subunit
MSVWGWAGNAYIPGCPQGIHHHLYEAAELDGTGEAGKIWNITIPSISAALFLT